MIPEGYNLVADIAVGGATWYECQGCKDGTVEHVRSCDWDCERCGAKHIFGCHYCPKLHNHPVAFTGENTTPSGLLWLDARH